MFKGAHTSVHIYTGREKGYGLSKVGTGAGWYTVNWETLHKVTQTQKADKGERSQQRNSLLVKKSYMM